MGVIMKNKVNYTGGGSGGGGNANEMTLTMAEYLALTEEQRMDGTTYYITDAVSTKEIQPVIYSEEERQIGVWTDGKPLYQKTIECGVLPNNTVKNVAHNISDIEYITSIEGWATDGTNFHKFSIVNQAQANLQVVCYVNRTNIVLQSGYNYSSWNKSYVTLQYTKTTDTAGSGIWTTTGEYAHHYSTDEKVVGTWIDGKPLYERVIIDSRSGVFSTGEYEIYSDASTYHLIPNGLQGMLYNSAGSHYPVPWIGNNNSTSLHKNASGKIVLTVRNDTYNNYILEVIIRYTKTTD